MMLLVRLLNIEISLHIFPFSSVGLEQNPVKVEVLGSSPRGGVEVGGKNFQCCSIEKGEILNS